MIYLRNALFYVYLGLVMGIFWVGQPLVFLFRIPAWNYLQVFGKAVLWGLEAIAGLGWTLKGADNIPDGPVLFASAQQSSWENIAFPLLLPNPAVFSKTELQKVPVIGWIVRHNDYIHTARDGDLATTKQAIEEAMRRFKAGRSILIFPEGTRNTVPGNARIKSGSGVVYQVLKAPCVPVVLNSGQFWPYRSYLIRPGVVTVELLEPLPAGLPRAEFEQKLKQRLDEGTSRLWRQAAPPVSR